jgi:ABC-2 type transport system permease protein
MRRSPTDRGPVPRAIRQYWYLLTIAVKTQTAYRVDLWLLLIGIVVLNVVDLFLLGVLLRTFVRLGSWTLWEVVFLYCVYLTALGLQSFFSLHLTRIEEYVQDGTLDQMLVRPVPALVQVVGRQVNYKDVSQVGLGIAGIVVAAARLHLIWTAGRLGYLVLYLVCGAAVLAGIALAVCSLAFWTVRSSIFLQGTEEVQEIVQHYPAHLFGRWFLGLASTLLPFAFVNYYPSLVLLGRTHELPLPILAYTSPAAAVVVIGIGLTVWHAGLRRYQGTGS